MTEQTTPAPLWRPTPEGARTLLVFIAAAVAVIGAIALALSFVSVDQAARPYFGAASWAIPVLMDTTIGVMTFFSIVSELNGITAPLARYGGRALVALTVYANVAPQHSLYGRILHGAPPAVWTLVVVIAENTIRRLMRLSDEKHIEALRRSLWLLRPAATWRIWRRMRIEQITTYRAALDHDAARAAVVGRLRVSHGRMWRSKAPLAERIALRLQGRDPAGVAEILTAHQETAALLAGPATGPQEAPEPAETGNALMPLDPIVYPLTERPVLSPFGAANALGIPFSPGARAVLPWLGFSATQNALENGQNAENDAENDRGAAMRMRTAGMSIGAIADQLGRSKSWVHGVVTAEPVEHANGSAA